MKSAIITGGNRGIGQAIVEEFAKRKINIWVLVRNITEEFREYCTGIEEKYYIYVRIIKVNLESKDEIKKAFLEIKQSKETIDYLVNNAGVVFNATYQMTSVDEMQKLFQVNLYGHMILTQYVLKLMTKQKRGSIVNIASSAGIDGNAGRTAYNASKAAIISTTKTLAKEMGRLNIRVNAVAPGLVGTDMALGNTPKSIMDKETENTALGRIGEPHEIAKAVYFLCSDDASYITGQVLRVDGGM